MSSEPKDWIRLSVKFRGKCSVCSAEIATGETALWSRTAKAVKHISCKAQGEKAKKENTITFNALGESVECFICGKPIEETVSEDWTAPQTRICQKCFTEPKLYQKYQEVFSKKMQRIANVKI